MSDWKYYNHALIPTCAPHETPNIEVLNDKKIWNQNGKKALFARWTTNWDCKEETEWWYVIKDEPFDITKLKKKRRYEINKGRKNFEIKIINPLNFKEKLYNIQIAAISSYPEKNRRNINYNDFIKNIERWNENIIFGAFRDNELCGYALLQEKETFIDFSVLKTIPSYEKLGINAAIVYEILNYYRSKLKDGYYISDGARNIFHETKFQDYLEKYFEFRKSYCTLHIQYKCIIKLIITLLFPIRKILIKSSNKIISKISAVLMMEGIVRKTKKW